MVRLLGDTVSTLEKIRKEVAELEEGSRKEKEIAAREETIEFKIAEMEKQIAKETAETVKTRRDEIAATFDDEEGKLEALMKQVKGKREKQRVGEVSDRIAFETERYHAEIANLKDDARRLFKQERVPGILNSGLFYTFFFPRGLKDFFLCLITFVLIFIALPSGLWMLMPKPASPVYLVMLFVLCALVFGALYVFLYKKTKLKYEEVLAKGNSLRMRRRNNQKIIRTITKDIKRDKDDTAYNLGGYDRKLEDLRAQSEELAAGKKEAMRVFDEVTKVTVTEEIKNKSKAELDALRVELGALVTELSELREYLKTKKLYVAENYEAYLGKDMVTPEKLDELLLLMKENQLATIGEALEAYQQKKE